jgi:hypothetical protein
LISVKLSHFLSATRNLADNAPDSSCESSGQSIFAPAGCQSANPTKALRPRGGSRIVSAMALPTQPVTLTPEQVKELNEKLSDLRHDVNNIIQLFVASAELVRLRPHTAAECLDSLIEQPLKISKLMGSFSKDFEQTLGIKR